MVRSWLWVAVLAACQTTDPGEVDADSASATFTVTEAELGADRTCAVLLVANIGTEHALDVDVGLDGRAARGIVAYRLGADRIEGTADDERFDTLAELDAIPYVGPRTLERLDDYVASQGLSCLPAPPPPPPQDPPPPPPPGEWVSLLVNGGFDESSGTGSDKVVPGWQWVAPNNAPYEGPVGDYVRTAAELDPVGTDAGGFALEFPEGAQVLGLVQTVRLPEGTKQVRLRWAERRPLSAGVFTGLGLTVGPELRGVYSTGGSDDGGWHAIEQSPLDVPAGTTEVTVVVFDYMPTGTFRVDSIVLEAGR